MKERPKYPQYDTPLPVTFQLGGIKRIALPTTGMIGNVSLGGLFVKASINQEQVREIIRLKQVGSINVDLTVELRGQTTELRGRIAWFDIAFHGELIQFRAGVGLIESHPPWVDFIEQVRTSLEDQQSEVW